jgi:hypothetical protein
MIRYVLCTQKIRDTFVLFAYVYGIQKTLIQKTLLMIFFSIKKIKTISEKMFPFFMTFIAKCLDFILISILSNLVAYYIFYRI